MLVPTQQLDPSSRYIVSIRNMVTADGQLIAPAEVRCDLLSAPPKLSPFFLR